MEFKILGPLVVVSDNETKLDLGPAMQRKVLAALLVRRNEDVSRRTLIADVWLDGVAPRSRESEKSYAGLLQTYISRLRKVLRADRSTIPRSDVIVTERARSTYRLVVAPGQLDETSFRAFLEQGRKALDDGDPRTAAARFEAALSLWRGAPLKEWESEPFAQDIVKDLNALHVDGIQGWLDAELRLGHYRELSQTEKVRAWVRDYPGILPVRRSAVALYGSGKAGMALDLCHKRLRDLGQQEGAEFSELTELAEDIRTGASWLPDPTAPHARTTLAGRARASWPLVGRDGELEALSVALADAQAGDGQFVLLAGESGIGKTHLAYCLEQKARQLGLPVWQSRSGVKEGASGLRSAVDIVRSAVRDMDPDRRRRVIGRDASLVAQFLPEVCDQAAGSREAFTGEGAHDRNRLFDAFATLLAEAAADTGALIVVDDLHTVDESSLRFLRFLAGEIATRRLLVLCTYRHVRDPGVCLSRLIAETREPRHLRLDLSALSRTEAEQLIEGIAGEPVADEVSAVVYDRAKGNPLFICGLVRMLQSGGKLGDAAAAAALVPQDVADVVRLRVDALSQAARQVLDIACVIGRDFDPELVSSIAQLPVDAVLRSLDETVAAELTVAGAPPGLRHEFAHPLSRDVLYDGLGVAEGARLHEAIGIALEEAHHDDPGPYLAEIASHFRAVPGQRPKALEYTIRAGHYEMSRFAYEQAVYQFTQALELPVAQPRRWDLLVALGDARMKAGNIDSAVASYLRAADVARSCGSAEKLARAALGPAKATQFIHARAELRETISELLEEALPRLTDTALRARVLATLAIALFFPPLDRWQEIQHTRDRYTGEALKLAGELGDDGLTAFAMHARSMALLGPDNLDERNSLAPQIVRRARGADDTELVLEGLHWQVLNAAEEGDLDAMRKAMRSYDRVGSRLRQPLQQYWNKVLSATLAILCGNFAQAECQIKEALSIGQGLEGLDVAEMQNGVVAQFFLLHQQQGRIESLKPLARMVEKHVDIYAEVPAWRIALGQIRMAEGGQEGQDGAREVLDYFAKDGFQGIPRDGVWLASLVGLAEICAFLGDAQTAKALYTLLEPYAGRCAVVTFGFGWLGPIVLYLGILAAASHQYDLACAHLDAACRTSEHLGARPWLARSKYEYARALLVRGTPGDHHRAVAMMAEARAAAAAIGLALPS
jgi:DNA-binding SARP family transcriptional activator/tetratricopeptide (TPR) repeat protein